MGRTKPKSKTKSSKSSRATGSDIEAAANLRAAESRTGVAVTVGWMLALMSTIIAEAIGLASQLYCTFVEEIPAIRLMAAVLLFIALASGALTLLLTPVVLRVAKQRPPQLIVVVAIVSGVLPLVALVLQQLA